MMDAREALAFIKGGETIVLSNAASEPKELMAALIEKAREVGNLTLLSGMLVSGYDFLRNPIEGLTYKTWFMPNTLLRSPIASDRLSFLPMSWTQTLTYLLSIDVDAVLCSVAPGEKGDRYSLGISASYVLPVARKARRVIAEVNPQVPWTEGAVLERSAFDALIPVDYALPVFPTRATDVDGERAARLVADLIPHGTTVQPGVGAIPNRVMELLGERPEGVRVHSMVTDGCMNAIDKAYHGAGTVAHVGEIIGSQKLYDWVRGHPGVRMCSAEQTHTLAAILELGPFVSINSALEVDLFGQANSEIINGVQSGAIGGSLDFMMAASQPRNLSILVLSAETSKGKSRIVGSLSSPVSIPRSLVQVVVTEHGVADLRGKSDRERAAALIAIAAPAHRDELAQGLRTA